MYGARLREARKQANYTLQQVADILHVSYTAISRYENNKRKLDAENLQFFCRLYNVSADYILGLPADLPYPKEK
jgi:transcriptional regulator with XRE-family HTH domain